MKSIRYYKYIIFIFIACIYSDALKPSNARKLKKVKISSKENTRAYYHLEKNGIIKFDNLSKTLDDNKNYTVKIISRAKIAKNSNSNKSFGFILNFEEEGNKSSNELKYKKKVSSSKLPDKKGFSYTDAGFWMEEIINPGDTKFSIEYLKGSPEIDIRVVYDRIQPLKTKDVINPINIQASSIINYLRNEEYVKSKHWFLVNQENKFQFKVKGPTVIRLRSRALLPDKDSSLYSFNLKQNGRIMSIRNYRMNKSEKDAHYMKNNQKIGVTKYNSFLFNVPEGINYYTIENNELYDSDLFLKIEQITNE